MSAFLMQVTALTINITISVSRIFCAHVFIFFDIFVAVLAYIGKCKGVYFDKVAGEQMIYNRE